MFALALRRHQLRPRARRAASTVGATLDEAVARLPHKDALRGVVQDVRWSYKELDAKVAELAHGFLDLHFRVGDVLAVWLPNSVENVVTQLAAARAGLVLAVIEPAVSEPQELAYILQDSRASGLVFEPKQAGRDQNQIVQTMFPELATCMVFVVASMRFWRVFELMGVIIHVCSSRATDRVSTQAVSSPAQYHHDEL